MFVDEMADEMARASVMDVALLLARYEHDMLSRPWPPAPGDVRQAVADYRVRGARSVGEWDKLNRQEYPRRQTYPTMN